jgi:hypothetical protein
MHRADEVRQAARTVYNKTRVAQIGVSEVLPTGNSHRRADTHGDETHGPDRVIRLDV